MAARLCSATRKDGTPCRARAEGKGEFCTFHSQNSARKRALAAGRRLGGVNSTSPRTSLSDQPDIELLSADDIRHFLSTVVMKVKAGKLAPKIATTCTYTCGVILNALQHDQQSTSSTVQFIVHSPNETKDQQGTESEAPDTPAELKATALLNALLDKLGDDGSQNGDK